MLLSHVGNGLHINILYLVQCIKINIERILFQSIKGLDSWDGQSPPTARTYKGKPVIALQDVLGRTDGKDYPNFGPYSKHKQATITNANSKRSDLLGNNEILNINRPANAPDKTIPSVSDVIGRALDHIGTYSDLDNRLEFCFKELG